MTSVVGGALGVTVSLPPYILGRVGLLMLGSKALLTPGSSWSRSASRCKRARRERSGRSR